VDKHQQEDRTLREWDDIYRQDGVSHKNRYPDTNVVAFMARNVGEQDHAAVRVLDLGCGWGNHLKYLQSEGYDAWGVEGSSTACEFCKTITSQIVCGRLDALDFKDGFFDVAVDRNSIQCNTLDVVEQILSETWRVLKPGGLLYSIILAQTNKPDAFHAYYLESPASRLEREKVEELFSRFSAVDVDSEKRTFRGGDLQLEQWHVVARK